ncbi:MAG: hypothetical protein ABIJ61_06765, partial [bacterium]
GQPEEHPSVFVTFEVEKVIISAQDRRQYPGEVVLTERKHRALATALAVAMLNKVPLTWWEIVSRCGFMEGNVTIKRFYKLFENFRDAIRGQARRSGMRWLDPKRLYKTQGIPASLRKQGQNVYHGYIYDSAVVTLRGTGHSARAFAAKEGYYVVPKHRLRRAERELVGVADSETEKD